MNLLDCPDQQINDLFTKEVAAFTFDGRYWCDSRGQKRFLDMPNYARSLDAVFPYLTRVVWQMPSYASLVITFDGALFHFPFDEDRPAASVAAALVEFYRLYNQAISLPTARAPQPTNINVTGGEVASR